MKITLAGSLGNIGKPLTKKLKNAGHDVTVISHSENRRSDIEALGAKAAIGSVKDAAFLKHAFSWADAVFAMVPPSFESGVLKNSALAGEAFATAIRETGVGRVVLLSSIGADLPKGTGPIAGLHSVEQLFQQIEKANITFLRAGYFYTNFYNDVPMIKGMNIMGSNFPATAQLPLVHPEDIAAAAAEALQQRSNGKEVQYIVSDVITPAELAKALGASIGKPELSWVEFTDEQALQGMKQAGLPDEMAGLYAEMGQGMRNGSIAKHFLETGAVAKGKIKVEAFAKEFAARFSQVALEA